jgi:hypothetical protein
MTGQYFPALMVGEFADSCAALASVGIDGDAAATIVCEANESYRQGAAYSVEIEDMDGEDTNAVLVLASIEGQKIRLCIGYPGLAAESEEAALMTASQALLPVLLETEAAPPTLHTYRVNIVRRTLH